MMPETQLTFPTNICPVQVSFIVYHEKYWGIAAVGDTRCFVVPLRNPTGELKWYVKAVRISV